MRAALTRIADYPINRIAELLPWVMLRSEEQLGSPARSALESASRRGQDNEGVPSQAVDSAMIEALEGASTMQSYQLSALSETMLGDPRRSMTARASTLHSRCSSVTSATVRCAAARSSP